MAVVFVLLFFFSIIMIPVALIKPSFATKGKVETRKKASLIYVALFVLSFFGIALNAPTPIPETQVAGEKIEASTKPETNTESNIQVPQVQQFVETQTPEPLPTATVKPTTIPKPTIVPTIKPTPRPTAVPTIKPTPKPTIAPTIAPAPKLEVSAPCGTYTNSAGNEVPSPCDYDSVPSGATAECKDGTYSFSQSRRGTCSGHGGVAQWL